jgi:hypothetical protein
MILRFVVLQEKVIDPSGQGEDTTTIGYLMFYNWWIGDEPHNQCQVEKHTQEPLDLNLNKSRSSYRGSTITVRS